MRCAVRTHLWSQPTICERTSYRAKMGISRMKWKCVPGGHHVSETCPPFGCLFFSFFLGEGGEKVDDNLPARAIQPPVRT